MCSMLLQHENPSLDAAIAGLAPRVALLGAGCSRGEVWCSMFQEGAGHNPFRQTVCLPSFGTKIDLE